MEIEILRSPNSYRIPKFQNSQNTNPINTLPHKPKPSHLSLPLTRPLSPLPACGARPPHPPLPAPPPGGPPRPPPPPPFPSFSLSIFPPFFLFFPTLSFFFFFRP